MTDTELAYRKAEIVKAWNATKDTPDTYNLYARRLSDALLIDLLAIPDMTYEVACRIMQR